MIRVLVVDDHAIVRSGLVRMCEQQRDLECVGQADNSADALRMAREGASDVMLLDVNLPGKDGIEILKQIRREKLHLAVLMLSSHPESVYAVRAIKAGASGYLNKAADVDELATAIRRVASGRRYITAELAEELASQVESPGDGPQHGQLSDREYQTMRMIGEGLSPSQIAEKMFLSVKTVSVYRARMMEKMGFINNAEITRYVIENELTESRSAGNKPAH